MSSERLTRVAMTGISSFVGQPILSALTNPESGLKIDITALVRTDMSPYPPNVKESRVDFEDQSSIASALRGIQFLIIAPLALWDADTHFRVVQAAVEAKVPYVMPCTWENNIYDPNPDPNDKRLNDAIRICKQIEQIPNNSTAYIALLGGYWFDYSLAYGHETFGFKFNTRKVTFFDDGTKKITTTTLGQGARAIVALLRLPEEKLVQWSNKGIYVSSFTLNQKEIFESVKRVTGTTDADWKIKYQSTKERYAKALEEDKAEKPGAGVKANYARAFLEGSENDGDFERTNGTSNRQLGLQEENLDEAVYRAILMNETWTGPVFGDPVDSDDSG
ncbi:Pinoresinol reductase 2 [Cladorrhinum sp. PSN259]|nr:Pinoresinol reductase 2 [Cladorrhinum sp. PSN259]